MLDRTNAAATRHPLSNSQVTSADACRAVRESVNAHRILRMKQLIERTKLSRATLYVLMSSDRHFPRKIKLTARAIGFLESEVDAWLAHRANFGGVTE